MVKAAVPEVKGPAGPAAALRFMTFCFILANTGSEEKILNDPHPDNGTRDIRLTLCGYSQSQIVDPGRELKQ